jgi:phosphopantetheine adenylyltransferase
LKPKLGIFAGSFAPAHIGHKNILEKAQNILGDNNVILAVGKNPNKEINNVDINYLSEKLNCKVIKYSCFLHELILEYNQNFEVVLIRGLRNGDDLAYETNQLKFIKEFLPSNFNLNVMFILADEKFNHISSSVIKQLENFRKDSAKHLII